MLSICLTEILMHFPTFRPKRTQVLSMSAEDYRKSSLFLGESIDAEFTLPDLVGQTEILTEEHR